jgi:hypothetical protein
MSQLAGGSRKASVPSSFCLFIRFASRALISITLSSPRYRPEHASPLRWIIETGRAL